MSLRTIIADESLLVRKALRDAMAGIPGVEVIDIAKDGGSAVTKICRADPDLVMIDSDMPGLSGIEVLKAIRGHGIQSDAVMVCRSAQRSSEIRKQAFALGALDVIRRPCDSDPGEAALCLQKQLRRPIEKRTGNRPAVSKSLRSAPVRPDTTKMCPLPSAPSGRSHFDLVLVGISTGGPKALAEWVPRLSTSFSVPIVIVQHMPALFTASMAERLCEKSSLNVVEAYDEIPIREGSVVIAPGGRHLEFQSAGRGLIGRVTDGDPLRGCKPSVDHMMLSLPSSWASRSLAIIMTGMGDDGVIGCERLRECGGEVWAQDKSSCTVFGMPRQVIERGLADRVFSLHDLPRMLESPSQPTTSTSRVRS